MVVLLVTCLVHEYLIGGILVLFLLQLKENENEIDKLLKEVAVLRYDLKMEYVC